MISNGTCYWAPDQKTDPIFIPCGNDAFGHKTCCQAGDKCVSSSACYNDLYGVTYLVGCSDPDYVDDSCPEKPGLAGKQRLPSPYYQRRILTVVPLRGPQ